MLYTSSIKLKLYIYYSSIKLLIVRFHAKICPPPPTPLQAENFHPEYHAVGTMLVAATLDVYKAAMKNLLPTPGQVPLRVQPQRLCSCCAGLPAGETSVTGEQEDVCETLGARGVQGVL